MQKQSRSSSASSQLEQMFTHQATDDQSLLGNDEVQRRMNADTSPIETWLGSGDAPDNLETGILYSNTSESDLETDPGAVQHWASQGYEHSMGYSRGFDLSLLAQMGRDNKLNMAGCETGAVASHKEDYIRGPNNSAEGQGACTFVLSGGPDVTEPVVTLDVANNGCLNLLRLARAANELVSAWGLEFGGQDRFLDYGTRNFEVVCTMKMNNPIRDAHSRDEGYVGGVPSDLKQRRGNTMEALTGAMVLNSNLEAKFRPVQIDPKKESLSDPTKAAFHPDDSAAHIFGTDDTGEFKWVEGTLIGSLAAARIVAIWQHTDTNQTWITEVPDMASDINGLTLAYSEIDLMAGEVEKAMELVRAIAKKLAYDSTIDVGFLDMDPQLKELFIQDYRKKIESAFTEDLQTKLERCFGDRQTPNALDTPGEPDRNPKEGQQSNPEGG